VTKWTKRGARRAVIVGVSVIIGVIAAGGALLAIHANRPVISYEFDAPSAPFGGGGTCFGCRTLDLLDLTGPAAGVRANLPTDPVFRGIVLTSDDLPDGMRNVRIMPDGYYLEFTDGAVRFVADDAPWAAMLPDLEPEWADYFVNAGVIDPD
jgi:hypothetical protein